MTDPDETTLPDGKPPQPVEPSATPVLDALARIEASIADIRLELKVVEINVRLALQGLRMVNQKISQDEPVSKELSEIISKVEQIGQNG